MAGFLQASRFHSLSVLRFIYTIALYDYYPNTLYHTYLIVSRPGLVPLRHGILSSQSLNFQTWEPYLL
jgi:hypothetical protein